VQSISSFVIYLDGKTASVEFDKIKRGRLIITDIRQSSMKMRILHE
jgi:hypothetical protein